MFNRFKSLMAQSFCLLLFFVSGVNVTPAYAVPPSATVYTFPGQVATYSATAAPFTTAASATDIFTIQGAAGKTIRITRISCVGTSTAAGNSLLQIVKRSVLDTVGVPVPATAVPLNSGDPAAVAGVNSWTTNPTLGAAVGNIRVGFIGTGTATALSTAFTQEFGAVNDRQPTLRTAAEELAVNANGASLAAGASVSCTVEWTEQ